MSLDAGGLAQMTYHHNSFTGGLGLPGSGFASRGKGGHLKRLDFAPPSKISTIDENKPAQPRTSRSHLLAGLRTAPKSPAFPPSAPPTQLEHRFGLDGNRYAHADNFYNPREVPQTATGASFTNSYQNRLGASGMGQMYSLPEQVLAPPAIHIGDDQGNSQIDPSLYDELVRTNQYLAQQQQRLQQQLVNVTAAAAAQRLRDMNIGGIALQQQYGQAATSNMGFYNQQLQQGLQPVVQPVPNQLGFYTVYNPMSGQTNYFYDQNVQQSQPNLSMAFSNVDLSHSPPPPTPTFRSQVSPPPQSSTPLSTYRSNSPPKATPSPPQEVNPLPPPSANAFRAGHRKSLSLAQSFNSVPSSVPDGPATAGIKPSGFPQTPLTGTFGPGQARAGEHPIRQPRGPPSLEELIAKPTTKFEGSKNFATRQRRRAVHNLVRAGLERRTASRGTGSIDSLDSLTPVSESEIVFSVSSDSESDGIGSGSASLSGKPSIGSLRAAANGAIGSERKGLKERANGRGSPDNYATVASATNDEIHGKERRAAPMLVLSSAEKRKNTMY
ncbi:MAG: hypothetical protein MMC33_001430 [Icmadophila ericetorum]|nr:hypothetical protein [Icmadophila ericetorum]